MSTTNKMSGDLIDQMRKCGGIYDFKTWLEEIHPDIRLNNFQEAVALLFLDRGRASGRSFLIDLLYEWENSDE